jgi:hypothetical protein
MKPLLPEENSAAIMVAKIANGAVGGGASTTGNAHQEPRR